MKLSEVTRNIQYNRDHEPVYVSNMTIEAVNRVISTHLSLIYNPYDIVSDNIPYVIDYDPINYSFSIINTWSMIRYNIEKQKRIMGLGKTLSSYTKKLLDSVDGEVMTYPTGFVDLGSNNLSRYPRTALIPPNSGIILDECSMKHYTEGIPESILDRAMTEKNINFDSIIYKLHPHDSEVIIIDSLANMQPKPKRPDYDELQKIDRLTNGRLYNSLPNRNPTLHHLPFITFHPRSTTISQLGLHGDDLIYTSFSDMTVHEDTYIKEKPWKIKKNSIYGKMGNKRKK